ncbi:hypothetical protein RHSIM_Rhsim06G0055700 [Rhododendron simsii]|uniref:non-specific serine/threonine protein kinase n=1 Tax=Rhododendron simsii TaxID=118357 RepID=A0A834GS06_RHOSS|nr:hypothetical protein RHSIM_Rhsim06G0055700 [Rhododendron simsii]
MEEELLQKLSSFVLTNEEEEAVLLDAEDYNVSHQECVRSAMGKILTQKGINLGGLKASMDLAWGYPKGLKVMEVGGGIYQFVFGKEMDLVRVIAGGPWLFNNQLIVLQRWEEGIKIDQINFSYCPFWIQLRALPLEFMSVEVGRKMMVGFGDVLEVVMAQLSGNQGRCIRVKVELDITKPLPRGKHVRTADWNPIWVSFRYEKFPYLCHYCGLVGHDDKACMLKYNESKAGIMKVNQYGVWLRASPVKAPFKKKFEGRPEGLPAESSATERTSQEGTEDSARDLHYPANPGVFNFGRRRLQWDSNNVDADITGGNVTPTLVSPLKIGPPFMGQMSGPRNAAVLKTTVVQIDGTEKTQSEGSIGSPKDIMEEDCSNPTKGESQKKLSEETQTLGRKTNTAKLPRKGKEITEKDEAVEDPKKPLSGRGYKKRQSNPVVRGGKGRGKGVAIVEQTKRKFEVALVEVEIAEETNQSMDNVLVVDPSGIAGGLAILWKHGLNVNLVRRSNFFIEVLIKDEEANHEWHLINLYASSIDSVRKSQWEDLLQYRQQSTGDWVLWGDFNDILWTDEKKGGRRREVWSLKVFRDFVASLGAVDLGFNGYPFTWSNRRGGDGQVKERLDRVLVAPGWRLKYDRARVQHLFAVGSDHAVLLLDTNPPKFTGYRQFRFDSRWANDPASFDTVCKGWQMTIPGSKMFEVFHKVRNTRKELRVWSKVKNFNARKKINELQGKLKEIGEDRVSSATGQIHVLEKELGEAWVQEESFWRQKARKSWLAEGDRNTAFFHAKVTKRRRRNTISGIQDSNGNWCEDRDAIVGEFVQYFQKLFQSEGTSQSSEVVDSIQARVTEQMNNSLTRQFSTMEIRQALFDMDPSKAPGADGMTAGFYQKYWEIVGEDVTMAVQSFFQSGHLLKSFNHSQIVLIPKVKTPIQVSQFRPISLCNVFYKIIAKALSNRLRRILPNLISKNQSAFIQNRQISDNILVAHEVVHYLKQKKWGKVGCMALKLDVAKAYDRVEWHYLEAVMRRMGFHSQWVKWIMSCVTSVSYSVNINGQQHGYVKPQRGLRQGDPLSPYLFLLCAEGFSGLLKQRERQGQLKGIQICRGGPYISHLLFADDSLVFCKATKEESGAVKEVLDTYRQASGQLINNSKSSILFSSNTGADQRQESNRIFTAGFHSVGENAYWFSIWFTEPTSDGNLTIVWMANRNQPVNGKRSKLSLLKSGNLILNDAAQFTVWSTNTKSLSPLELQLLNTGNLILRNQNGSIWESFDWPTDTLLPNQPITRNSKLVSSRSHKNFSSGFYALFFDYDNVLHLIFDSEGASSMYWPDPGLLSWAAGRNTWNNSPNAAFNSTGYFRSSDALKFKASDFGIGVWRRADGSTGIDTTTLEGLQSMLNVTNPYVQVFRTVGDIIRDNGAQDLRVRILSSRGGRQYSKPNTNEIAALLVGDGFESGANRDIVVQKLDGHLHRINETHPAYMPLQYLLLFRYGTDGWRRSIEFTQATNANREGVSMREFYAFRIQFRDSEGKTLLQGGRLFQQFVVDCYVAIEQDRLNFVRCNQNILRSDFYSGLRDAAIAGDADAAEVGTRFILPSSFTGGPRNMNQHYQDAMAVCRAMGFPDLLLTLTCKPSWSEIQQEVSRICNQRTEDRTDILARVFRSEMKQLMRDIKEEKFFGKIIAELKVATRNFREEIGSRGSGIVYKGVLSDRRVATIKRLNEANQGEAEFLAEVSIIGRVNHMNLIEIWGYCVEGNHRLLVYEYMECGLLGENRISGTLDWEKRFDIAVGSARGLAYLHEECLEWVLHCDVKPQNILLDPNFQSKVADFGLSKLINRGGGGKNSSFSRVRGTRGYMAPEEIEQRGLVKWAREKMNGNGENELWLAEIIDPIVKGKCDLRKMGILVQAALECVKEDKDARPTMSQVIERLPPH